MPKYTKEFKTKVVLEYLSGELGGRPMVAKLSNLLVLEYNY